MIRGLFLLFAILFTAVAKCPLDWAEYQGKCVYVSRDQREWLDAANHCRAMDGFLATDDSEEKHTYLSNVVSLFHVFNEKTFWIGGDDYIFEGTWRWTETGAEIGSFTKWKAGSPSTNTSKNCLAMTWEGDTLYWFDDHCRYWRKDKISGGRYNFICEKPAPQASSNPVIG